ncbi:hypothetical protein FALBO_10919 [Fusarium albosuccineum]|uniref:Uncharacterized protein n=1 Tax=Fusarium albosuccineum TaxID=1237068 RepID=A0A8H4PI67_9HYPO|nr:hypothetical protein FALBO_10919 [Fusarium albosuccineum]
MLPTRLERYFVVRAARIYANPVHVPSDMAAETRQLTSLELCSPYSDSLPHSQTTRESWGIVQSSQLTAEAVDPSSGLAHCRCQTGRPPHSMTWPVQGKRRMPWTQGARVSECWFLVQFLSRFFVCCGELGRRRMTTCQDRSQDLRGLVEAWDPERANRMGVCSTNSVCSDEAVVWLMEESFCVVPWCLLMGYPMATS